MPRITYAAAVVAFALASAATLASAWAQGVAPGGSIGNSTGIGAGLGVPGTGPSYPNGTGQPTLAPPPPPGGGSSTGRSPVSISPPSTLSSRPSSYPQPIEPFASSAPHQPSTVPLTLSGNQTGIAFLKGCWRSDVFQYEGQAGVTTWCFDDKGAGKYMYMRRDQPSYVCHGLANASYGAGNLKLHNSGTSCSGGGAAPGDLACQEGSDGAQCKGETQASDATVRLYRVR